MTVSFTQDTVIDHTFFPPKSILDPGCFDTVLIVSGTGILLGETYGIKQVCFNIDHPYDEDIRVYLVSPSDVTVELVNNRGGGGDDFINTCFDGNPGSPTIASGMPPFTGSYQSELPLGLINNGGPMDGNWQLFFCHDYNVSEGHIEDFSITFGDNAPVVLVADNDNCNQYFDVAVNNDYKCINYTEGTLSFATASPITSACVGSVFDDDVWFSFIAVDTEHKISVENINPATELIFEVLAGDCNNFTSIICSNSNEFLVNNLSPGSRYYIRIASENNEVNSTLFNV